MPKLHKDSHKKLHELNARVCQAALQDLGFTYGGENRQNSCPPQPHTSPGLLASSSALSSLDYQLPLGRSPLRLPIPSSAFFGPGSWFLLLLRFSLPSSLSVGPRLSPSSPAFLAQVPFSFLAFPSPDSRLPPRHPPGSRHHPPPPPR